MHISICTSLSLSYMGGGEKWVIQTAKELVHRGHTVEIYALPILLEGKRKVDPKELLDDIPYTEGYKHKVKADIVYMLYNPLNWMNFNTSKPRIAGVHSEAYWQKINPKYGFYPNLANIMNKLTFNTEFKRFDAIHMVTKAYKINHPNVYHIPNFVDSNMFKPTKRKDNVFTVAYSSRMVWQKGWDIFEKVKELIEVNDFNVKITAGKVPEEQMPDFLSESHVTLVPSRVDTFGLSICESELCKTPVITSPLNTHIHLELPLLYATNVREYVKQVYNLKRIWEEEPQKYNDYSNYCRTSAMRYDKKNVCDRLEQMFKEVSISG